MTTGQPRVPRTKFENEIDQHREDQDLHHGLPTFFEFSPHLISAKSPRPSARPARFRPHRGREMMFTPDLTARVAQASDAGKRSFNFAPVNFFE